MCEGTASEQKKRSAVLAGESIFCGCRVSGRSTHVALTATHTRRKPLANEDEAREYARLPVRLHTHL